MMCNGLLLCPQIRASHKVHQRCFFLQSMTIDRDLQQVNEKRVRDGGRLSPKWEIYAIPLPTRIMGCVDCESRSIFQTQQNSYTHECNRQNPTTSWRAISFWEREGELPLVTWLQVGDPLVTWLQVGDLQGRTLSQHSWATQTELSVDRVWGKTSKVEWIGRLG